MNTKDLGENNNLRKRSERKSFLKISKSVIGEIADDCHYHIKSVERIIRTFKRKKNFKRRCMALNHF